MCSERARTLLVFCDSLSYYGPTGGLPSDDPRIWPNIVADHLGWRPRIGLREGLQESYRWYKETGLDQAPWDFAYEQEVARSIPPARISTDSTPPQGPEAGLTPPGGPSPAGGPGAGNP